MSEPTPEAETTMTKAQLGGLIFISSVVHAIGVPFAKRYLAGRIPDKWETAVKDERLHPPLLAMAREMVMAVLKVQGAGDLPWSSLSYEARIRASERERCLNVVRDIPKAKARITALPKTPDPPQPPPLIVTPGSGAEPN